MLDLVDESNAIIFSASIPPAEYAGVGVDVKCLPEARQNILRRCSENTDNRSSNEFSR
jgi:7-keto-8-aminopelargonate synthetase-like enzyme